MTTIECVRSFRPPTPSPRVAQVSASFGLNPSPGPRRVLLPMAIDLRPGQITAFVGPSGSGKSSALREISLRFPLSRSVQDASPPCDRCLVDCVSAYGDLTEALSTLSACGLSEAPLWLRRFDELSDGEKFRARLAMVIGMHADTPPAPKSIPSDQSRAVPSPVRAEDPDYIGTLITTGHPTNCAPILCDEFCAGLHHRAAVAIAHNLRKLITRRGLCLVVAVCDDTLLAELQPDVVVRLRPGGGYQTTMHAPAPRPTALWRRLRIEPGGKQDYDAFAAMHYRETDELGFVDCVFVLRERGGEPLGIVVYAHSPLGLVLRNEPTASRFTGRPDLLNREVRILRRLVIHPDVRGCGLGRRLVARTLPRVGTPFVECLASMGDVNPVFERAGMTRVGRCPLPADQAAALDELTAMNVDPFGPDFVITASRAPRVREIVARSVRRWYEATTGQGAARVAHQSPRFLARLFRGLIGSRPVYYLWKNSELET